MAEHVEAAKQAWHQAQKLRKHLQKEVDKLKTDTDGNELKHFEVLESVISSLRLACLHVIFHDFEYSAAEKVEANLWQAHGLVNTEYRKVLGKLRTSQLAVQKRKLDRMYSGFLKTAQKFYVAFVQRMSAVYPIPELQRIAEGIKAEKLAEENPMANTTPAVRQIILKYVHLVLIHLGDLSRYRMQARHKVPSYEAALTYYSLAHDILPNSGFAHHQMGIIYLDERKHLDIIYHFYRAMAIQDPHPMAAHNLEAELKSASAPSAPARRTGPPDPQEAFVTWFVKLHSHFSKGEPFPQHEGLEKEVINHLEMAIKAPNTQGILLKMVLLNMSAFYVYNNKAKGDWATTAFRTSQFLLRLNARFFLTFCKFLKKEMEKLLDQQASGEQESVDDKATTSTENTLPFVRLYAAWLVACRAEIVNAQETPELFIKDMYRGFAKALTSLCEMYGNEDLKLTPYLLPEDQEAIGMLPLCDPRLPDNCRLNYDEDTGNLKPQIQHYSGQPFGTLQEIFSRVLHTIKCGFFLANDDPKFPFSYTSSPRGLTFKYEDNYTPKPLAAATASQPTAEQSSAANVPTTHHNDSQRTGLVRNATPTAVLPVPPQAAAPPLVQSHPTPGRGKAQGQSDYDFSSDADMLHMVNDFLMPPQAHVSPAESHEDTTYGMNSAMANEVFGVPPTNSPPALGSATAKTFPSLPWNMIYTPTPQSKNPELTPPDRAARDAARRSFDGSAGVKRTVQPSGTPMLDDPLGEGRENPYMARQQQRPYASTPDISAHQDRLLQAFGKQPTDSRSMSRDFSGSGGYGLWPIPYGEVNPNALQPRAAATHSRSLSGSRPQFPQSPNMVQRGETFSPASGTQFSNISSIYQSTPCNGIAYTATTAFGRGPIADMREDPTHYKNLVRQNGGAATDGYTAGYNDMILQSAMADEGKRTSGQNMRR
ncbi:telomerase activating protein Est1 [Colletotrichum orchidophilum]|uniref:Nonsense-mediated mRNA decay factor n=1 Tax=Colletotrichum orchidophilum TaxID=1209926 RepID=A0A1G4B3W1_9PEZI|nr:telomerase activating protein Est1 [Colletotrichum orchidophilum]OHE96091.1 telomerase activating protein Est1 [Colletotrichum orchidophilum]